MDLEPIGSHCAQELCNDLDFLPIRCPHCTLTFCRHHIQLETHGCAGATREHANLEWVQRSKCAMTGCQKPSLESAVIVEGDSRSEEKQPGKGVALCERCEMAFCASHRYPSSHNCVGRSSSIQVVDKNAAGKALLAKAFPSKGTPKLAPSSNSTSKISKSTSSSSNPANVPSNPSTSDNNDNSNTPGCTASTPTKTTLTTDEAKRARLRKVELMRMRQQAIPADPKYKSGRQQPPPVDQRRHLVVRVEEERVEKDTAAPPITPGGTSVIRGSKTKSEGKVFWFIKDVPVGRAIDMLCTELGITGVGSLVRVRLEKVVETGRRVVLRNDQGVGKEVEDEEVYLVKEAVQGK